jgi:hypothetical protein
MTTPTPKGVSSRVRGGLIGEQVFPVRPSAAGGANRDRLANDFAPIVEGIAQ